MLATGCSLAGVAALAAVLTAPQAVAAKGPAGSAYALSVTTTLLDRPLAKIDPRPLAVYPRGGGDSVAEVGPNAAGLVTANALNASSLLKGRTLVSEASIADVTVKNILSASVISADCAAGPSGLKGKSSIADLTVLGQKIDVTAPVPGEIDVLGIAKVRVNEQIRKGDTITVNAVHVIVGGPVGNITSADIVLSQAKCTRAGTTQPPTTTTTTPPGGTTEPTEPPSETTEPSEPTDTTSDDATPTSSSTQGITKTSNDQDLAETGASGILPISLTGLALLAAGGTAMVITKRRRAAKD
jgi:hypothetical protein